MWEGGEGPLKKLDFRSESNFLSLFLATHLGPQTLSLGLRQEKGRGPAVDLLFQSYNKRPWGEFIIPVLYDKLPCGEFIISVFRQTAEFNAIVKSWNKLLMEMQRNCFAPAAI